MRLRRGREYRQQHRAVKDSDDNAYDVPHHHDTPDHERHDHPHDHTVADHNRSLNADVGHNPRQAERGHHRQHLHLDGDRAGTDSDRHQDTDHHHSGTDQDQHRDDHDDSNHDHDHADDDDVDVDEVDLVLVSALGKCHVCGCVHVWAGPVVVDGSILEQAPRAPSSSFVPTG